MAKKSSSFNPDDFTFRSPKFKSIVDEAVLYFINRNLLPFPLKKQFSGAGVYALYFHGKYSAYKILADKFANGIQIPIYVGKAVLPGARTARIEDTNASVLFNRLNEHADSIRQGKGLSMSHFSCRFIILQDNETDLIAPIESALIRRFQPLWNYQVDGFGNHDPGSGRYGQKPSEWDTLHKGRYWAKNLTGVAPDVKMIKKNIDKHLAKL